MTSALAGSFNQNQYDQELAGDIAQFYSDPYGFVMYAYPWGVKNGPLEHETGPDTWQRAQLNRIGAAILLDPLAGIQEAIASGHGIGKSAEVAWIVQWAMSTRPHLAGWVTANTQNQLTKKTWREVAVWHKRLINKHWFEWTATRFYHVDHPETWGIDAIPWTEHNSEAFAGLHAEHVLMIMDEGSGIADSIWEVSEGAMTTPRAIWLVYGNPTRNTGRFFECFGSQAHRWEHRNIDSRNCKMTQKDKLEQWREDYGEDSDFFRVRCRGEFPHHASNQLIGSNTVATARDLDLAEVDYIYQPTHVGCDVARFGDDETVISVRQGRKHVSMKTYRGLDNMQVGAECARIFRETNEEGRPMGAIYVDGIGLGGGVVDYLSTLGYPVIDVNVGKPAEDKDRYFNKRVECWDRLRQWLEAGADIVDDPELGKQLTSIEYEMMPRTEQMKLEGKDDLKARGLSSPDRAESLGLTFAEPFAPSIRNGKRQDSFEPEIA